MNKKHLLSSFIFILIAAACTKKATPAASAEKKPETNTVLIAPAAPAMDKAALIVDGEKVYTARCGKCHELHEPKEFTASEWPGIMRSMAPKAKLNESMKEMVMAYVTANAKKG